MAQAPAYAKLERHMDYQARIKDVLARVDAEFRMIAADLEREAKQSQRYGQKSQEATGQGDFKGR